jgi:hypothetical protein
MVSPLFIEVYGALIFLSLIRVGALYSANKEESQEFLKTLYFKALENPNDAEKIYYFGNLYYSFEFPDKRTFLDFVLNAFDSKKFHEIRLKLINMDRASKKLAA